MAFSYSLLFFAGLLLALIANKTAGVAETLNAKVAAASKEQNVQSNFRQTQNKEINLHNAAKDSDPDDDEINDESPSLDDTAAARRPSANTAPSLRNKAAASPLTPAMVQMTGDEDDEEDTSDENDDQEETPSSMLSLEEESTDENDNNNNKVYDGNEFEAPKKSHTHEQESDKMKDNNAEDVDDSLDTDTE